MKKLISIAFVLLSLISIAETPRGRVKIATRTPAPMVNALTPLAGTLIISASPGTWAENQIVEPSFFYDSATSNIKIYYTGSSDSSGPSFNNRIGLTTTSDMVTFTANANNPRIGQGNGGAPSGRRASSSWVGKLGSTYYCLALNGYGYGRAGEDANIYGYSSTDGITWTDRGLKVNKATAWSAAVIAGFGNTAIVTDQFNKPVVINGKYVGLIEGRTGSVWELYRATADSLMGAWTLTDKLTTLQIVPGAMYGGAQCFYINGNYHVIYHYGSQAGNLPTYLAYAMSTDCLHWAVKEAPFKTILATPYPNTDQVADPFMCEINGKVYLMAEYVQNSPTYQGQLRMWTYNGTFLQMVNGL